MEHYSTSSNTAAKIEKNYWQQDWNRFTENTVGNVRCLTTVQYNDYMYIFTFCIYNTPTAVFYRSS